MSTHPPQPRISTGPLPPHTPIVPPHFLTTRRIEPNSPFGESQQQPETPFRPTTSRTLYEAQTPEQTQSQTSTVTLQSPFNLPSPPDSHLPRSPQATLTPHTPQRQAQTTRSPFVIYRNPNFRPRPRARPRAPAPDSPLQGLPVVLDSSERSFHTPIHAQPSDVSMTSAQPPRLTYSPSTLQSPVAVTPGPHGNFIFTIPGSGMSWSSEAPETPFTP
jgi:hypothetical protein